MCHLTDGIAIYLDTSYRCSCIASCIHTPKTHTINNDPRGLRGNSRFPPSPLHPVFVPPARSDSPSSCIRLRRCYPVWSDLLLIISLFQPPRVLVKRLIPSPVPAWHLRHEAERAFLFFSDEGWLLDHVSPTVCCCCCQITENQGNGRFL